MSSMPTASLRRCNGTEILLVAAPRGGKNDQLCPLLDQIADAKSNSLDGAVNRGRHSVLHLHRLDDHQGLAPPHRIAHRNQQLGEPPGHRGGQAPGPRIVALSRGERIDLDQSPAFARKKYRGFSTVVEHGGMAPDTVEHNPQAAVEAALARGSDHLITDAKLPTLRAG